MKNSNTICCLTAFVLFALSLAKHHLVAQTSPDVFGYRMASGGSLYAFEDISESGGATLDSLTEDDAHSEEVSIGFPFRFYEQQHSTCYIGTNGYITFGRGWKTYYLFGSTQKDDPIKAGFPGNVIPGPRWGDPKNIIAPFFCDLNPAGHGTVLYKTVGIAPNRKFIVQWQDVGFRFGANDEAVTFQIQLHEGSNIIEFHYKKLDRCNNKSQYVIGIENDYNTSGITYGWGMTDDYKGFGGIPDYKAPFVPFAVRFERPVIVTVESAISPGTPLSPVTNRAIGQQKVALYGTHTRHPDPGGDPRYPGATVVFEAPEFIYFSKDGTELDDLDVLAGTQDENTNAYYRARNLGFAIDGEPAQGTARFVTRTINDDFKVVWKWELEYAVFIDSATGKDGGFGNPDPGVGRFWYAKDRQFSAAIDTVVNNEQGGVRIKNTGYTVTSYPVSGDPATETSPLNPEGNRAVTKSMVITNPVRIQWLSTGQVRYRIRATAGLPGLSDSRFDDHSFVSVYNAAGVHMSTTYGRGSFTDVWIDTDAEKLGKVIVGAFYRTTDRCFTLGDFPTPQGGDLGTFGRDISAMTDVTFPEPAPSTASRLARIRTFNAGPPESRVTPSPTEIQWVYNPTIFRAEVPMGVAFDPMVSTTIPELCDGAVLSDEGPLDTFLEPVGDVLTGTPTGSPWRWDKVGKQLFPVHPGSFRIVWQDRNDPTKSYKIEIVSGYPGADVNLTSEKEDGTGKREGSAPNYVRQTTLRTIDESLPEANFPAQFRNGVPFPSKADDAHYHHLFDPVAGRRPPTKLDLSNADEWKFQELTYTDNSTDATADIATAGVPFSSAGLGRSVVLYSYRPNSDEAADGNLSKERLAVRVIRSGPVSPILPDNPKLVLGRRGLELGGGAAANEGAIGLIQPAESSTVNPGSNFVIDFWLNAKGLKASAPLTLENCTTVNGFIGVSCDSTAGLVPGMGLSGTGLAPGTQVATVTSATSFQLSVAATANGSALSMTASRKPVTVLVTGGGKLKVVLDPGTSTITADYLGIAVTQPFTQAGAAWRHCVVHAFTDRFFGVDLTLLDFYVDGVRNEQGFVTALLSVEGPASSIVGTTLNENSLRFGIGANPLEGLQIDQFRLFANLPSASNPFLTPAEIHNLRTVRDLIPGIRDVRPHLWFSFETHPAGNLALPALANPFANNATTGPLMNTLVGPVVPDATSTYAGAWAHLDIQEVATRLDSTLDNAGFGGSGYILNAISNYNASIYNREAEVGTWGAIFPVNDRQLFTDPLKRLEVAYYENPFLRDPGLHPNVAWPYEVAGYDEITYPAFGPHKHKAIYIASRIGSEGVDRKGRPQEVFDLARFSGLEIYNQPDAKAAGYNPNEEHALVAPSGRAALRLRNLGEDIPNNPPLAAFALQRDINATNPTYSSDPWVLVKVDNLTTGEREMAAYQIFKTRGGTIPFFPRPSDSVVNATPGLAYEGAANPEDRILTMDPSATYDFVYEFKYTASAGDLLIPPYPLNLVIGNTAMADARGNSVRLNGVNQRTLWRDVNGAAWVVSGDGRFFHQFFYPMRGDFYYGDAAIGTPVAWVPDDGRNFTGPGANLNPVKVVYDTFWRSDYPKLKRGETLTYQGGEYFNEMPGSQGLPKLVAMAAAEVVYDSATPSMVLGPAEADRYEMSAASARIIRPLDRREQKISVAAMASAGFTPAAVEKVLVIAERWYFKELPGSLQKRFYFDSLAEKLVFRGLLNGKESGDPNLTVGPDPINILEPNVMTADEYKKIRSLSANSNWTNASKAIFLLSQNPEAVNGGSTDPAATVRNLQGVKNKPAAYPPELSVFWNQSLSGLAVSPPPSLVHLDSFGVGASLVPNSSLLTRTANGSLYITIAENNRSELAGTPVSLHIIEIIPDRYRGAIKVVEGSDAFSERITLQHNGDFGANTGDLYYEWWIRDAAPIDVVATEVLGNATLKETDAQGNSLWQQYVPRDRAEDSSLSESEKHLGLHTIVLEGRPDVVLADKLVFMRYRHRTESNWKLVPFELTNPPVEWKPGSISPVSPAPFQWAGASNSPQLQADGSKRYIPQLVMGWVKRVLDRINPYEARYADFFSNESPAVYSSQIQITGPPYAGKVALNPDKNVIENTGLIELYETVLARARELSIDNSSNPVSTDAINQALLLAATRLSVLYELLAREAYSDAQDPTVAVTSEDDLPGVASSTHAFQNMEADLMHEELALLRGTDFRKSYPVYNRLFWNYAKGIGEAAYNVNYNIYDANSDGFINEDDARKLYPQGHGDSWGHFVSAIGMQYTLLQHPGFNWRSRPELYSLMQNVLEVDFLDEKTFAKLAAGRARAGRDIVRSTYRMNYTQDPDGQWQGYTDGADPARAWGVSEWAHRAGQAAHFDWAVANALLPADSADATPVKNPENLDRIERLGAVDEIGEVSGGLHEIQLAMDEANGGVNPLGFDADAITFDIDPYFDGLGWERKTYFEQIYERAVTACGNAMATLDFAAKAGNKLRYLETDTESLIVEAFRQDLDYRNRLIEIFGRPYDGAIGFGKAYPEGYEGPDTQLFAYLDRTRVTEIVPETNAKPPATMVTFRNTFTRIANLADDNKAVSLYANVFGNAFENLGNVVTKPLKRGANAFGADVKVFTFGAGASELSGAFGPFLAANTYDDLSSATPELKVPVRQTSPYAFQSGDDWGQRTSYGKLQLVLEEELRERISLDSAVKEYVAFLQEFEVTANQLDSALTLSKNRGLSASLLKKLKDRQEKVKEVKKAAAKAAEKGGDVAAGAAQVSSESTPKTTPTLGLANSLGDALSALRGAITFGASGTVIASKAAKVAFEVSIQAADYLAGQLMFDFEQDEQRIEEVNELNGVLVGLVALAGKEEPLRNAIGIHIQNLELLRQEYITTQAEGFRLLREREAFNKVLAAKAQRNRYQDMVFRLSRNEAMSKYQSAFGHAARYVWLAARAYDYETSLDPGDAAAPGQLLDRIVKERQLGLWTNGQPQSGQGGLAEILNQLNGNFQVLKGQLGINNPQSEIEKISLRSELFRIMPASENIPASDARWTEALKARIVPDLTTMPEFVRYCRPFSAPEEGPQPGIVIRFGTRIDNGVNFFGNALAAGDHKYSTANFATKVRGFGVWLENYNASQLAISPRAYMVPVGNDYMRTSSSPLLKTRVWSVMEQRIPMPFTINKRNLASPGYIPTLDGVDGGFGQLRRHGNFRMYHDNGDPSADDSELILDSRLIGRSVWNSEWLLVIPGADLHIDPDAGLKRLAETVSDIKLHFQTYSHQGR